MPDARISERFKTISSLDPAANALWFDGKAYCWGDLRRVADGIGAALAAGGVSPGQPVAWIARNDAAMVAAALGLLISGNAICPVNPLVPPEKIARDVVAFNMPALIGPQQDWSDDVIAAAKAIGAVGLIVSMDGNPSVRVVPGLEKAGAGPFNAMDPDVVLQRISSGTTGDPKRFEVMSHTFIAALEFAATSEPGERSTAPSLKRSPALSFTPFGHSSGLWGVVTAFYHGRPLVLHARFTVEGWRRSVEQHKPKMLSLMPAMISMILEADVPKSTFDGVRAVRSGSAPLPPSVQKKFEETYGVPVLVDYGASEFMGGIASWSLADRKQFGDSKRGSVGRPRPDIAIRIVDAQSGDEVVPGEIGVLVLKTPRHGPDWVRTTDLASLDGDGFLFLHGRADEAINRGGFKILPEQVAEVLRQHASVRSAAVLGVKDARLGEVPVAVIELLPGKPRPTGDELVAYSKQHMPPYFVPVAFEFVDAMPLTNSLKISRPGLRDMLKHKYAF